MAARKGKKAMQNSVAMIYIHTTMSASILIEQSSQLTGNGLNNFAHMKSICSGGAFVLGRKATGAS